MKLRILSLVLLTTLSVACSIFTATQPSNPEQNQNPAPTLLSQTTAPEQAPTKQASIANTPLPNLPNGQWQPIPSLPRYVNILITDPQNPQILYAATGATGSGSGVYKSEDGGLTWELTANGLPSEDVVALTIDTSQPPVIYAMVGIRGDIYASTDNAQSWKQLGNSDLFGGFEYRMYISPQDSNVIFALSKSDALARSSDGGHTWIPLGDGLPKGEHGIHLLSLAIDPTDSNIIYAGTGGFVGGGNGVYKSTDGGQSWLAINQGMLDYRISALSIDPNSPQTVYAGADDGTLFKTSDGGQNWVDLSDNISLPRDNYPAIQEIIFDTSGTIFLLAKGTGVFSSKDEGQTWQILGNPGETGSDFSEMVLIPSSEPALVIGGQRNGAWRYGSE